MEVTRLRFMHHPTTQRCQRIAAASVAALVTGTFLSLGSPTILAALNGDWKLLALARLAIGLGSVVPPASLFRSMRVYVRFALRFRVLLWTIVMPALWLMLRSDLLPPVSLRRHASAAICDTAFIASAMALLLADAAAAAVPAAVGARWLPPRAAALQRVPGRHAASDASRPSGGDCLFHRGRRNLLATRRRLHLDSCLRMPQTAILTPYLLPASSSRRSSPSSPPRRPHHQDRRLVVIQALHPSRRRISRLAVAGCDYDARQRHSRQQPHHPRASTSTSSQTTTIINAPRPQPPGTSSGLLTAP